MSVCGFSFGVCAIRVTRLDADGNVIAGNNSYVSDKPIQITVTPNYETGNSFSLRNGCGCGLSRFKADDTFNWFELQFTRAAMEPVLEAFLIEQDEILDGSDVVGVKFTGDVDCDTSQAGVGFEFWTQHLEGNTQDTALPWVHWVFPRTIWRLGDSTYEENYGTPVVQGFSRENGLWGQGPYNDGPPDGSNVSERDWWFTDIDPPSAECNALPVTATS